MIIVSDNDQKVPIKIWVKSIEDVEKEALQQIQNVARLPFVFKHIAVMPDVHYGKGATIGSVIANQGAICPAAVGVDIACFIGETKIPLLNGKQETLKSLWEQTQGKTFFYVYSIDPRTMTIVPGKARCVKTQDNAALIKIIISGGEEIICTLDHKFMLKDGTYKEAKDLIFNESLMPFYRKWQSRDGYESVYNGKGTQKLTHKMVSEHFYGKTNKDFVIHHKDHNHFNNDPDNLCLLNRIDHTILHRKSSKQTHWQSAEFEEKRKKAIKEKALTPEGKEYFLQKGNYLSKYIEKNKQEFKKSVAANGKRGKEYLIIYNKSEKGKLKSQEVANKIHRCNDCGDEAKGGFGIHLHRKKNHGYNHKVISIEKINYKADVYCLQVEDHHNFALSAGVFVHNCGMMAVKLDVNRDVIREKVSDIRKSIERSIPVGFASNQKITPSVEAWNGWKDFHNASKIKKSLESIAKSQLGSLGGGNHFIELCEDQDNNIWVMLHSGSRNIGKTLAEYHIEKAKNDMKSFFIELPDPDLAYLVEGKLEFHEYMQDLDWLSQYAFANRAEMMQRILKDISFLVNNGGPLNKVMEVNCHHNYVSKENHFGKNVLVIRKGAVQAREGVYGIIPGSMGTRSYIVKGKGNPQSFHSCSHGAGRIMSRTQARKTFNSDDLINQTIGVECRKDLGVVDEIPGAYKDIDTVMENQNDLVEIVATLKQFMCIKG